MSNKQDRAAPRTVTDILRQYKFGKTFAETMGLAKTAQNTAAKAAETSSKVEEKIDNLVVDKLISTKTGFDPFNPAATQTLGIDGGGMELKHNQDVLAWLATNLFGKAELGVCVFANGIPVVTGTMYGDGIVFQGNADVFGIANGADLGVDPDTGISFAHFMQLNDKTVEWKSNGDGTYTLIGRN